MNLPPLPIFDLSMEQSFHLVKLNGQIEKASAEQLRDITKQLLKENMILKTNVANLVKNWND